MSINGIRYLKIEMRPWHIVEGVVELRVKTEVNGTAYERSEAFPEDHFECRFDAMMEAAKYEIKKLVKKGSKP